MLEALLRLQVMPWWMELLKQRVDPKTSRDEVWGGGDREAPRLGAHRAGHSSVLHRPPVLVWMREARGGRGPKA